MFELVEQVLSMLVTQHQQFHAMTVAANANASQTGGVGNVPSRPCLAVNHIRDQLIPPTVSISSNQPPSFWFDYISRILITFNCFFIPFIYRIASENDTFGIESLSIFGNRSLELGKMSKQSMEKSI